MADILVERINASYIRLYIEDSGIVDDLYTFFRYEEPGFVKNKYSKWDGVVRLFNKRNFKLPYGCLNMLINLAKERGYTIDLDDRFKEDITKIDIESINKWIDSLDLHGNDGSKITPYEYQYKAVYDALRYGRMVELLATSAGKSLVISILARFYLEFALKNIDDKIMIVVPSVSLVTQLYADMKSYFDTKWKTELFVHCIYEGQTKYTDKPIIITTYQSMIDISKHDPDYFKQFTHVIEDEVHMASSSSITTILNLCVNAYKRIGLTGTIKQSKVHAVCLESLFGVIKRIVTTKQLQDGGMAAQTKVTMLLLEYSFEDRKFLQANGDYQSEIDFLINQPFRNKVIKSIAKSMQGNTLILFDRVDAHLTKIVDQLNSEESTGKKYLVITGKVKAKERDEIKALTEGEDGVVIFATWGCMSTGVSIKRLHNLLFAHPSKSIIRILQSLGRTLRLHSTKDIANIYDIVDDLRLGNHINHTYKHGIERYGYYTQEQHEVRTKTYKVQY